MDGKFSVRQYVILEDTFLKWFKIMRNTIISANPLSAFRIDWKKVNRSKRDTRFGVIMVHSHVLYFYCSVAALANILILESSAWSPTHHCNLVQQRTTSQKEKPISVSLSSRIHVEELDLDETTTAKSMNILDTRRSMVERFIFGGISSLATTSNLFLSQPQQHLAFAAETKTSSSSAAEITDRIFLEIKGLPSSSGTDSGTAATTTNNKRIVIGLFGKEAPESVPKLKQLVTQKGLSTPCKPRAERMLQKEQLEANKVYNNCIESQDKGVNYDYSSIWRVIKDERIDVGAVAGKFIAREYPDWQESAKISSSLKHDASGIVSVRRGNEGGFGFVIYPGNGGVAVEKRLDEENIVVGKVIEGMDIVKELNQIPIITSSKVNYMGLTGGPKTSSAPTRACQYGGAMYCNEYKPLIKLSIMKTGLL